MPRATVAAVDLGARFGYNPKAVKKKKTVVTTLRHSLSYEPVELAFGTSGLRGLVRDMTNLEVYVNVRGFLSWLTRRGDVAKGGAVFVAGDLRPSTSAIAPDDDFRGDILQAVSRAIQDHGLSVINLGLIPTPALVFYAMRQAAPSIMVTGSHIPFDRNGLKFTRPSGEMLKADEQPVLAAVSEARRDEYERPFEQSIFDERGMLKPDSRVDMQEADHVAAEAYVRRYAAAFPRGALEGKKVLVWEHSAVGRDLLVRILRELGALVVTSGRSDTFVAVDTEAVNEQMIGALQALVDSNGGASLSAVVSTDGDGDRPLVLAVDAGHVSFIPGDLLGLLAARFLGVRHAAVPISCNDAVDEYCRAGGIELVKTRIGSPYVIEAMRVAGWEGNGGFLTAAPITVPGGGALEPLPTRDAVLPILCALLSLDARGTLPKRYSRSEVLRDFPMVAAHEIMRWLTPSNHAVVEADFVHSGPEVSFSDGTRRVLAGDDPLVEELGGIRAGMARYFDSAGGFPEVRQLNWLDGVRARFSSNDVVHLRPSGNAPEMRLYTNAAAPERARAMALFSTGSDGALRRMARDAEDRIAIASYRAAPRPFPLFGAVQNYAWGGSDLIPGLLGIDNAARKPYAELWMGAHPRGTAQVEIDGTRMALDRLIAADPWLTLGPDVALRFAGRLPYLFKVLDVKDMASIQAHPSRSQAEEGFARENAAGIGIDAPNRIYRDENHKPEVHVVLTDFWMLHGFRPLEEMIEVLSAESELAPIVGGFAERLGASSGDAEARPSLVRELYRRVMTMPQFEVDAVLDPLVARLEEEEAAGRLARNEPGFWALRAARTFPPPSGRRDRGIFSIYILNLVHLRPGQGTFQPSGTLHAYLEGADVELMANSDNVLRGGLTPKHVDVEALLGTLSFRDGPPPILEGRATSETSREYETPAEEFALERIEVAPGVPYSGGREHSADSLIVTDGAAAVVAAGRTLLLQRGGCAIVPANVPYSIAARAPRAVIFKAGVPAAV
jgi:mannose-6-phosphate isomerase class I